jgi:hypothetical protein
LRRPKCWLAAMLAFAAIGGVTGCGTGGYFINQSARTTITVTGASGSLVRSTTVTLTVQ